MHYSYLALGDSYTIGEGCLLSENFPYQTVQQLRARGNNFQAPEILAKTGWTTTDLLTATRTYRFLDNYDFVTLLIGVNNQYQQLNTGIYQKEFEQLLRLGIGFCGNNPYHALVLSIPDWGVTPYAQGHEREKITQEIDAYNLWTLNTCRKYEVDYIDITPLSRLAAADGSLLAADLLHPSPKMYEQWSVRLTERIAAMLSGKNITAPRAS